MERPRSPYSIHKRPTKKKNRHIYYVKFRDTDTGKYTTAVSSGCTRRDDAVRWAEARLVSGVGRRSDVTFRDYATGFWDRCGRYAQGRIVRGKSISSGTLEIADANTKNHLIPMWGDMNLSTLTMAKIDSWIIQLHGRKSLNPATINKLLQTLRIILTEAVKDGLIPHNPSRDVKPLKERPEPRGVLTLGELQRLFTLDDVWPDDTHFAINLLAAGTGMRMGEIRGLGISAVTEGRIEIIRSWEQGHGFKEPKCGSCRTLPLCEGISDLLNRFSSTRKPEDLLFYGKRGKAVPVSKSVVEKYFNNGLTRIGISEEERRARRLSFHSYRHTLITILRAAGVLDSKVYYIAGHQPTEIQDRYTHYGPDDINELVDFQRSLFFTDGPRLQLFHLANTAGTLQVADTGTTESLHELSEFTRASQSETLANRVLSFARGKRGRSNNFTASRNLDSLGTHPA
jgi:integrase